MMRNVRIWLSTLRSIYLLEKEKNTWNWTKTKTTWIRRYTKMWRVQIIKIRLKFSFRKDYFFCRKCIYKDSSGSFLRVRMCTDNVIEKFTIMPLTNKEIQYPLDVKCVRILFSFVLSFITNISHYMHWVKSFPC